MYLHVRLRFAYDARSYVDMFRLVVGRSVNIMFHSLYCKLRTEQNVLWPLETVINIFSNSRQPLQQYYVKSSFGVRYSFYLALDYSNVDIRNLLFYNSAMLQRI